ncbi:MAG: 50S ribosomal protein L15e [Candidatus Bathyarchaeia archaeon]
MYRHLGMLWKNPSKTGLTERLRDRAILWRRQPSIVVLPKPTRLDRAHSLGYHAKQGYVVARVRVRRGGLKKIRAKAGRRQKKMGILRFTTAKSLRRIAVERAAKKFPNLKMLNSYWVWKDGKYHWFEVIMADPHHPVIASDHQINWTTHRATSN